MSGRCCSSIHCPIGGGVFKGSGQAGGFSKEE
jgi:hypothetical protein